MLILYDINHNKIEGLINYKDLKLDQEINVEDTLSFLFPNSDLKHNSLVEECYIRTEDNEYVIKEVNYSDDDWTEYICKINIESIKGRALDRFETIEQSCTDAINLALVSTDWTIGSCNVTKLRTVCKNNCSAYEVLQEIQSTYHCEMTFNSVNKLVYIYQIMGSDRGSYFAEQLNLKSLSIQRNSYAYITRLIPIGKDGLDITSVNSGLNYLSNTQYSNKVFTAYWEDNRYTDPQTLKDDGVDRLAFLSLPYKSYSADILDLSTVNGQYSILDYDLGDTITILAHSKNTKEKQRIIQITRYLEEPERNTCSIANKIVSLDDLQVRLVETTEVFDTIITSDGLLDGTKIDGVEWVKIKNISIITANIQDAAITTAKIGNLQVTTAKIALLAVDSAQIALLAVGTAQIANAAITNAKIGNLAVDTAQIANAAITTAKILDANITTAKIALLAVDTAQIAAAAITTAKIALGAITTALIGTAAVDTAQIKDGSITDAKIVSLTANKISAGTIDAAVITVTHLNAANITVGTINGVQIANGAIDVTKLTSSLADSITTAQSTANGKNTSYYQTTAPSGGTYKVNDIWFDTDDNYKMYFWNGTTWTAALFGATAIANGAIGTTQLATTVNTSISTAQSTANTGVADALTAHNLADSAQGSANTAIADALTAHNLADTAQGAANTAQSTANTAKAYTDNLALDSVITPDEKFILKPKWDEIVAEGFPALTNLLGVDGNFEIDTNSDGLADGLVVEVSAGATFSLDASVFLAGAKSQKIIINGGYTNFSYPFTSVIGHIYYSIQYARTGTTYLWVGLTLAQGAQGANNVASDNVWDKYTSILTATGTTTYLSFNFQNYVTTTNYADCWSVIDLTAAFGAGNEPTAAQFEAMQTTIGVGKNLFDGSAPNVSEYDGTVSVWNSDKNQLTVTGTWFISKLVQVLQNTNYHLDFNIDSFTVYGYVSVFTTSDGVTLGTQIYPNTGSNFNSGVATMILIVVYGGAETSGISIYSNIQLELGSVATPYVPYIPSWFGGIYAYGKIPAQALSFGVDDSVYDAKFAALHKYLIQSLDLFTAMTTAETGLVRDTWDLTWNNYYLARTDILNTIAEKAKTLADTAQTQANLGIANAATAQETADNIQIGGRNLLRNSKALYMDGFDYPANVILTNLSDYGYRLVVTTPWDAYRFIQTELVGGMPLLNVDYVLSCDVRTNNVGISLFMDARGSGDYDHFGIPVVPDTGGVWQRIYCPFKFTMLNNTAFIFGFTNNGTSVAGDYIEYRNAKVEKGTRGSDWTPAPEDVTDAILISANGKNTVYYGSTAPTGGAYKVNDIWFDTDEGNIICNWNGTVWSPTRLGTNAIANLAITNALIADGTILNAKISTLDAGKITTGYILAARIDANTITATMIATDAITAIKILAGTITAAKMVAGTITAASAIIADAAITTAKIALLAVTNAQIADATILNAKISTVDAGKITTGYLLAARIEAGSIVTAAIAAGNITVDLLATNSVTAIKIAAATITGDKLVIDTITAREIATGCITANEIAVNTITAAKIAAGTITAAEIAAGTITAAQIAAGTITAAQIAADAIFVGGNNMLMNTSFEQAIDPYSIQNCISFQIWNSRSYDGQNSLFVESNGGDAYGYMPINIPVKAGHQYVFSMYYDAAAVNGSSAYFQDQSGTHYAFAIEPYADDQWHRKVFKWTCPAGVTSLNSIRFGMVNPTGQYGWIAFDCIQLEEGSIPTAWSPSGSKIDGNNITTGTISADRIASKSISGAKMADGTVGDLQVASGLSASKITAGRLQSIDGSSWFDLGTPEIHQYALINSKAIVVTMSPAKPFELNIATHPIIYISAAGILITSECDVNEDGVVDLDDYKLVRDYILNVGTDPGGPGWLPRMDINHDGHVNSIEMTMIYRAMSISDHLTDIYSGDSIRMDGGDLIQWIGNNESHLSPAAMGVPVAVGWGDNLDTYYGRAYGNYKNFSWNAPNCPSGYGFLECFYFDGTAFAPWGNGSCEITLQRLTDWAGGNIWTRVYRKDAGAPSWTSWVVYR